MTFGDLNINHSQILTELLCSWFLMSLRTHLFCFSLRRQGGELAGGGLTHAFPKHVVENSDIQRSWVNSRRASAKKLSRLAGGRRMDAPPPSNSTSMRLSNKRKIAFEISISSFCRQKPFWNYFILFFAQVNIEVTRGLKVLEISLFFGNMSL